MAVFRYTKSLVLSNGQGVEEDTYIDQSNPNTNYGSLFQMLTGLGGSSDKLESYVKLKMPPAPDDCDVDFDYQGIKSIKIKLKHAIGSSSSSRFIYIYPLLRTFAEDTLTWNTKPAVDSTYIADSISISDTGGDSHTFDLTDWSEKFGVYWDGTIEFRIVGSGATISDNWNTREWSTLAERPEITIEYYAKYGTQITDLAVEPYGEDMTPKLFWTPNEDEDFSKYQIWRKVGAAAWAQLGSDITEQGTAEYLDDSATITENNVIKYKVRLINTDTSYIDSNEVWLIRPDVSAFTLSGAPPDVKDEVVATVQTSTYPTTPTPVNDTAIVIDWTGEGNEKGEIELDSPANPLNITGSATYPFLKYRYFQARDSPSTITPKVRVINSLGFASDWTDYATPFSVTSITPEAKIKCQPRVSRPYIVSPLSGTVTLAASVTVTGSGTKFLSEVRVGDAFCSDIVPNWFIVESIESDTQLTLTTAYSGGTGSGHEYMIVRNATIRFNGEESLDRNSNGTLTKYEFWIKYVNFTRYWEWDGGHWGSSEYWNDMGSQPYLDVPLFYMHDTGKASVKHGSKKVTGNSSVFTNANVGDIFGIFGSKGYVIAEIVSNTELILEDVWDEASATDVTYVIISTEASTSTAFEAKVRVTNTFTKTDISSVISIFCYPQAGIDIIQHLKDLRADVSLFHPTESRDLKAQDIPDSDDVIIIDQGRDAPTVRIDGKTDYTKQYDVLDLIRTWIDNSQFLRLFDNKNDRSIYMEGKITSFPLTRTSGSDFEFNLTLVIYRRVN